MLRFLRQSFLFDGQGADRQAILYVDKSCCLTWDYQKQATGILLFQHHWEWCKNLLIYLLNPTALRMARTLWRFARFECNGLSSVLRQSASHLVELLFEENFCKRDKVLDCI